MVGIASGLVVLAAMETPWGVPFLALPDRSGVGALGRSPGCSDSRVRWRLHNRGLSTDGADRTQPGLPGRAGQPSVPAGTRSGRHRKRDAHRRIPWEPWREAPE